MSSLFGTGVLRRGRWKAPALLLVLVVMGLPADHAYSREDSSATQLRVVVFTPTTEGNTYWPEVHKVMSAAALALEMELVFHEFDVGDRFAKPEIGVEILRSEPRADAAIFSVAFGQAGPLMDAAEALEIPFFLNGPLFPAELRELGGGPRRDYRNWIGYFYEDEEEKGYLLAQELISAAVGNNRTADDGKVWVVGVGGDTSWYGSVLRERGLQRAVDQDPSARLLQTVPTRWSLNEGREMTTRLLQRYPELTVVWAASDQLSLGAADALQLFGKEPGVDAFTGGLDLSLVGLTAVSKERLTATVASPPLVWARVLVYLHDYLRGVDFAEYIGTEIVFAPTVARPAGAAEIIRLQGRYEDVAYRQFSRYYHRTGANNAWQSP